MAKLVSYDGETIVRDISFNQDGTPAWIGFSKDSQTKATYTYSAFSSLQTSRLDVGGVRVFEEKDIKVDSRGLLKNLTKYYDGREVDYDYGYDAMGKLMSFGVDGASVNYSYDDKGNLTAKNGVVAGQLSVSALASQTYDDQNHNVNWQYDGDGRVTQDDAYSYQYNHAGRLTLVTELESGEWISHFLYDGQGNRVRKMSQDSVTYYYRNPVGDVMSEENVDLASGEVIKTQRQITSNGVNIASVESVNGQASETKYQFNGRLGSQSVRWHGSEVTTQDYSPYGEQMDKHNIHDGTYGFTGHEDDTQTDSTYMKARHYRSAFGRMSRPDPARDFDIFNPSSFNLYAYVGNNPVNAFDPSGLKKEKKKSGWNIYSRLKGLINSVSDKAKETVAEVVPVIKENAEVIVDVTLRVYGVYKAVKSGIEAVKDVGIAVAAGAATPVTGVSAVGIFTGLAGATVETVSAVQGLHIALTGELQTNAFEHMAVLGAEKMGLPANSGRAFANSVMGYIRYANLNLKGGSVNHASATFYANSVARGDDRTMGAQLSQAVQTFKDSRQTVTLSTGEQKTF
ncbi:MAG: RHS repeat-associated core domain-containing protein [Algicola sp.]|nr:RHS repeat-associated core domain-containing protein [Algicola sp.]